MNFFSLPSELLVFVLARLAAADSPASYIASGIGATSTVMSTAITTVSTTTTATPSYITAPPTTGTGSVYASSCNTALQSWSLASVSWSYANGPVETETFSSGFTQTYQGNGSTTVTSLITLCDGYPRVVGKTRVSAGQNLTTTVAWTNTFLSTLSPTGAYPTPPPCSIQTNDCIALSSSFNAAVSSITDGVIGYTPQCSTAAPLPTSTYSTNDQGGQCDNCLILANSARLLYWPVTTVDGSGNLCNKTASTITASATPPPTFVTEGITITSPTVAISFGYMSRADDCGPTITHTIIPVDPDQVSSVRGYNALFSHYPFNFADLNYKCFDTNSTNYTIASGGADSCYQEVPAAAYWGGLNNAAIYQQQYVFRTWQKYQMTIFDDYRPQILPPDTMTPAISSIWGDGCIIHPDGVWDPPIALEQAASIDGVGYGPGATTSTSEGAAQSTAATPASAIADQGPTQTASSGASAVGDSHGEEFSSALSTLGGVTPAGSTAQTQNQANVQETQAPASNGGVGSSTQRAQRYYVINGVRCTRKSSHNGVEVFANVDPPKTTFTITRGAAPATVLTSAIVAIPSDAPDNVLVLGSGNAVSTITAYTTAVPNSGASVTITEGSKIMTAAQGTDGVWTIVDGTTTQTLSAGGSAMAAGSNVLTAASSGLVRVGVDASQSTITTTLASDMTVMVSGTTASIFTDSPTITGSPSSNSSSQESRGVKAASRLSGCALGSAILLGMFGVLAL